MMKPVKIWMIISLIVAGVFSLFASSLPDGYEKAGEQLGYIEKATTFFRAPFPDYQLPGMSGGLSGSISGVLGVLLTFLIFIGIGSLLGKKK
ncbi:PDGLE domain-containing protein [Neobacillus sp. LXY-4]|uniref:PDGLE domain-containing protein n=1 Tax=Neobacillus sp. LXY-4 TaxID=3379826 RepID=UPI003EE2C67A